MTNPFGWGPLGPCSFTEGGGLKDEGATGGLEGGPLNAFGAWAAGLGAGPIPSGLLPLLTGFHSVTCRLHPVQYPPNGIGSSHLKSQFAQLSVVNLPFCLKTSEPRHRPFFIITVRWSPVLRIVCL